MERRHKNNIRLGIFVMAGVIFLIFVLLMIGKNRDLFGKTYVLYARFESAQGLIQGNDVRFAGIHAGTVKNIEVISDTMVQVKMQIKIKLKPFIYKNSLAYISTDGLMGNKLVNIETAEVPGSHAEPNDILHGQRGLDTDEMLKILDKTNRDVAIVAGELKKTVQRINNSSTVWNILDDPALPGQIRSTILNARSATARLNSMAIGLDEMVQYVQDGKGTLGTLVKDSLLVKDLDAVVRKVQKAGQDADSLILQMAEVVQMVRYQLDSGQGTAHAMLKDPVMARDLQKTLKNIEQGTAAFNENMEALKTNFLFRGYFKRQERLKEKEKTSSQTKVNF